jgi:peptide chain release factor 1
LFEKLDVIQQRYDFLCEKMCDVEIINNPQEYRKIAKERSELEETVMKYREYKAVGEDIEEARRMKALESDPDSLEYLSSELRSLTERHSQLQDELMLLLTPKDPRADKNIIMEIRAGAGGEEAALFAGDLFRMYGKYAEKLGWKTETISSNPTELGGFKEIIFSVTGRGAWARFKYESGVHRVQRVPDTEASGRIHTSTITVAVLIEAEEMDVEINPVDLRIDTFRSSGAGGQHVNKTESAVRITHLPTGLVVACQDERSQHQNREKAMRVLRAKLLEMKQRQQEMEIAETRRNQVGTGDRSEKIRTYNYPQSRITDHRIGLTVHNLPSVLEGNIDEMIEALMLNEQKEKLKI